MSSLVDELERYGATPEHLVDLSTPNPRALRFADLMQTTDREHAPVVVESNGHALVYVVDGRVELGQSELRQWVRRIAFRGDADWLGVLQPGRLDIYSAVLDGAREPRRVDDLPQAEFRLPALAHKLVVGDAPSVHARLRSLLFQSMKRAGEEFLLPPQDALSLVGRALFWRFLVDRGLLDRLEPDTLIGGPSSWAECFDRKHWALDTFAWLDSTFNGGFLEFETPAPQLPDQVFTSVAGGIAHKADASGQLSLPASWAEVDFAYVPVGLLSEVYEAYVHDANKKRATDKSLFYTPRHLAEYIVDEALDALEDVRRPRFLDPAAGAGVFLVVAFRALIAREWKRRGTRPSRKVIRRVLNEQIRGFDIDGNALRLAELALYLTAIELDPERRPQPLELLKFKGLRGTVLLEKPGGKMQGSLARVADEDKRQFHAVVGNPPWTALKLPKDARGKKVRDATRRAKEAWTEATRAIVTRRLGAERAKSFKFPDANPDLPFIYRAMEWTRPGGVIALITHARWLFAQSDPAEAARKDLLESVHFTGVLNGAALRQTKVWPNIDAPFCMVFATNEPPPEDAAFYFVSPELDTADLSQDRLRIDWRDAEVVEQRDVVAHPWLLKARFRGSSIDESVLRDASRRGVPLRDYLEGLGTKLCNGYQPGKTTETPRWMRELHDLLGHELTFFIDARELENFRHERVHRKRKLENFRAPLLVVHESMVVDDLRPRAGLARVDVAYDERFDGVSLNGVDEGLDVAKYLQIVLQSSLTTHLLLMLDGQFGVEREVVHLETYDRMPVVPWHELTRAERSAAAALSERLHASPLDHELRREIDAFVAGLHGLSEVQRDAVADTLATGLTSKQSRVRALSRTTAKERRRFIGVCAAGLDDVLSASELAAHVRLRDDLASPELPWRFIQVDQVPEGGAKPIAVTLSPEQFLRAADAGAASLVIMRVGASRDTSTVLIAMLDRYRYWTQTRARLLASLLLAEEYK